MGSHSRSPRRARGRRAQSLPLLAAGLAAIALLVATLARYRARAEATPPGRGPAYLGDEGAALPAGRRAAIPHPAAGRASRGTMGRSPAGGRSSRHLSYGAATRLLAAGHLGAGGRASGGPEPGAGTGPEPGAGSFAYGTGSEGGAGEPAAILVRAFGLPEGDYVYHRDRGWMRFDGQGWVLVRLQDLPPALARAYPDLMDRAARVRGGMPAPRAAGGAGGDGEAALPAWLRAARAAAQARGP